MGISLGYEGEVFVSSGDYRCSTHNKGTDNLFKLLSVIFGRRDAYTSNDLPGTVMLFDLPRDSVVSTSAMSIMSDHGLLSQPVSTTFYPEEVSTNGIKSYRTVFTAYINSKQLANLAGKDTSQVTLALMDQAGNSVLAAVSLPEYRSANLIQNIASGNQALIKWTMIFSNKEET